MRQLELLAPARDLHIGIAAIDCGADAVYIAGPQFGARQAAGNSIEDIRQLCSHAHKFGARIFAAVNTILYDDELESAYGQMLDLQEAGVDALIVQDMAVMEMVRNGIGDIRKEFRIPLHASTQCAIRTPQQAAFLEGLGFSRLILERELSLEEIREIRKAVSCELEFFVHGALCVCYSGQCYLSEKIAGRSANRGACIQACRSRYDLVDENGKVIVKDKALLSLKDYNLRNRIEDLAEAGITSFKIEGRLKNASYVRNVVRDYSLALDEIISRNSGTYERGSFGSVLGGFVPDTAKTFNRGYTELFLDGRRGKWAAMDAAKSMGEKVGEVCEISKDRSSVKIRPAVKDLRLNNGDGFSFVTRSGDVAGFRGDVCEGYSIRSRSIENIYQGAILYRNINAAFEKELERSQCTRMIAVSVSMKACLHETGWTIETVAESEDGRRIETSYDAGDQTAGNMERMRDILKSQISKNAGSYSFNLSGLEYQENLPLMSASSVNAIRRDLAARMDMLPCGKKDLLNRNADQRDKGTLTIPEKQASYKNNISNRLSQTVYQNCGAESIEPAYELLRNNEAELMRTRYCIRYELGICPKHHGSKENRRLFLLNNGQRFALHFDCRNCEMTVREG